VARGYEEAAIAAMQCVATRCGVALRVDRDSCCGALAAHLGRDTASRLPVAAIEPHWVSLNSGCTRAWTQAMQPLQVSGVAAWLETLITSAACALRPQALRVVLHVPCSQASLAGEARAMARLIQRIPGAELLELPAQPGCCGAAGTYFLNQAAAAQQLADEVASQIIALNVDRVVSANGGCRAHLAQALHERGSPVRIMHPAELIADHLMDAR
jgi:glycolate oxidase iron-sulfur subunit